MRAEVQPKVIQLDSSRVSLKLQQPQAAATLYQQAIELDKTRFGANKSSIKQQKYQAQMSKGYSALQQKDFSRAIAGFEGALALFPSDATSALNQTLNQQRQQQLLQLVKLNNTNNKSSGSKRSNNTSKHWP